MLVSLRLKDFGILEDVEVGFGPALTVLTGETGAGKSLVLDALGLLLGGKAGPEVVRSGASEAVVEGIFACTPEVSLRLQALGLDDLGLEVLVRRVVPLEGRSRVHVNGALTSVAVLQRLMRGEVDLAGQHEYMALFDVKRHLAWVDRAANVNLADFQSEWTALQNLQAELRSLGGDEASVQVQEDFLAFQVDEIEQVSPLPGEDVELEKRRRMLVGAEKLKSASTHVEQVLSSNERAAAELIGVAINELSAAARLDPALESIREQMVALQANLDDIVRSVAKYSASIESDPERLLEVDDRIAALKRLGKKHQTSVDGLLAKKGQLKAQLLELRSRAQRREEVELARVAQEKRVRERALVLRQARKKAARLVERSVCDHLARLAMNKASFEVRVLEVALSSTGLDAVEFWFTANAGEPLRALEKIVSGGEASRLMLALRSSLSDDAPGTCVFDEADAGVGGAVADAVGRLLGDLSRKCQVLCVTHLPQVAAHADHHLYVTKQELQGRTRSRVTSLDGPAREKELARMLSGVEVSKEAMGAAQALLSRAREQSNRSLRRKKTRSCSVGVARLTSPPR
jgi:DNA repair protein RecN (Recombination protein N)